MLTDGKHITDEELLQDIKSMRYTWFNGDVFSYNGGRHAYVRLAAQPGKNGRKRYYLGKGPRGSHRKRTISAAKFIWMIVNRQVLPAGHEVDHIDENNMNDHPSNLRALPYEENRSRFHKDENEVPF